MKRNVVVGFFLGICINTGYAQSVQPDLYFMATDSLPRIELRNNTVQKQRTRFDVWIDPTQSYTIDSILKHKDLPFNRTESDILSLEYQDATIWCRFVVRYYESEEDSSHSALQRFSTIVLPKTHKEPFIITTMNRQADTAMFFCVNPATGIVCLSDTNGYSVPFNRWSVKTSLLAFMIPDNEHPAFAFPAAQAGAYKDMLCYVQFRADSFSIISLRAVEYDTFFSINESGRAKFSVLFGIFFFAACYNLMLFFVTRSRFYFFYVGSVMCFALYHAIDSGQAYSVLQTGPGINTHLLYASGLLYNALSALFVRAFWMERREYVPRALNRALLVYVSLNITAIVLEVFGAGYIAYFMLYYSFMLLGAPVLLAGTFLIWRKGYTPARYLFIARCFSEIGMVLNILLLGNLIRVNIPLWAGFLAARLQDFAPILELFLFSFALAARFTTLQEEKQVAERKALEGELYRLENEVLHNAHEEIMNQQREILEQSQQIQSKNDEIILLNTSLQENNAQLVEISKEKDELMGIVSHDLKNPIGAVRGYAELIENQTFKGDEVVPISSQIVQISNRMLELVKNLLDLNHLESGILQLNMVSFDISPIVQAVVEQYHAPAEAKQITLHYNQESSENIAFAEEQALMQVLDNLISNAVKYSPLGKRILVRVVNTDRAVRIEIQDEGPGLSEDDKSKLFGKFARLSARPTGGEYSTGLGLSIVKKMVEAMNGKVWCESELGKGATFIVELPCV